MTTHWETEAQPAAAGPSGAWPSSSFLLLPAIDLKGGRCVRLQQGDLTRPAVYSDDPVAMALRWQEEGARALHVVDLDGAASGEPRHLEVLRRLTRALSIPVQFGGGLRTSGAVAAALDAGAARVVVGTAAVLRPLWTADLLRRHPDRVVVAVDARQGRVATHGWQEDSGLGLEDAGRTLLGLGVKEVLYTDIPRDGMLTGADTDGARRLAALGLRVLASGGVSRLDEVRALAGLSRQGVAGAVVGKALYEGKLCLPEALRAAREAAGSGLTRRIVPCLDVRDGRVVKGVRFTALRDAGDPAELAAAYDRAGADELVFYDISASPSGRRAMPEVVARVAAEAFIPLTVGGGIADLEDIRRLLRAGADKVSINTQAVLHPDLIARGADRFGSQCITVGVDTRRVYDGARWTGRWEVVTHGGRRPAGRDLLDWVTEAERLGAGELVLNSMDADGTADGYDLELNRAVADRVAIPVVASGGAGRLEDFYRVLTEGGADAALAASLFHFGRLTIAEVKQYLAERGVPVRWAAAPPVAQLSAPAGAAASSKEGWADGDG